MGMTTGRTKVGEAAMDLAALADDLDQALNDILAAADVDAKTDVSDDDEYSRAHQLIGQVPLMSSAVDKDSFAIRAHRAIESAMRKDLSRIAGDGVRRRIMPEHERIKRIRDRLKDICRQLGL